MGKAVEGPSLLSTSGLGQGRQPGPPGGLLVGVGELEVVEEGATRSGVALTGSGGRVTRGS
jgi:hypothetical protein